MNDGDNLGVILATNLKQAKKKWNKISKDSDGYIPEADEFDFEELKIYK